MLLTTSQVQGKRKEKGERESGWGSKEGKKAGKEAGRKEGREEER